jgi:2-oxoglutarate ferredoxin oxidoreductase subunit alpha
MISPFPTEAVAAFIADCGQVLVPEVNYQGQFAGILQSHVPHAVTRLARVPCAPMEVGEILAEIRRLAGRTPAQQAA